MSDKRGPMQPCLVSSLKMSPAWTRRLPLTAQILRLAAGYVRLWRGWGHCGLENLGSCLWVSEEIAAGSGNDAWT